LSATLKKNTREQRKKFTKKLFFVSFTAPSSPRVSLRPIPWIEIAIAPVKQAKLCVF